ncbi:MAG: MurR/RpiR family transcriptional regulator [Streptococcaceae bacterium]|jgi:RpiR family glv operon transcriptional regulator|nr:MurR/RpiR family transcriptional regulator [Streptococcaceae bacterium]
MTIENSINRKINKLGELDEQIALWFLSHLSDFGDLTIDEIAKLNFTSKSSISRFIRKIGYEGFAELKYEIKKEHKDKENRDDNNFMDLQTSDVQRTMNMLKSEDLTEIISKIIRSNNLYCYGTGHLQNIAIKEFSKQMVFLKKWVRHIKAKTEFDITLPNIQPDDFVILVSLSGETVDVLENIANLKLRGISTLTITKVSDNQFSKMATHSLFYYATPFSVGDFDLPVSSMVGLNLVLDTIFRKACELDEFSTK